MQLPFLTHLPSFDVLPSTRLAHFYQDPKPPLSFFQACFTEEGLHLQLRAYEIPTEQSYFCFTLLSGSKLCFAKRLSPDQNDFSLHTLCTQGENLMGHHWTVRLFVPKSIYKAPLTAIVGLFHGNEPLCFLCEQPNPSQPYPMVRLSPKPHPAPSSTENPRVSH